MVNREYQFFNMPIEDVIKSRHSVRTYNKKKLDGELKTELINYARDIKGPFSGRIRLELIDESKHTDSSNGKIGTYGIIRGAGTFIAGVVEKGEKSLEELGYCMEKLILYATSLGLGTCWLGGTFSKGGFSRIAGLKENEILPIVTPVGYPADNRSIVESLMRRAAGSDNRKAWNELFFSENFETPMEQEAPGVFETALEMIRLAPSASNKQPWRILKKDNCFHFYLKGAKGYDKALGFSIQRIDMGIAMCHFEMTLKEEGIKGHWVFDKTGEALAADGDMKYTISWIAEK